MSLVRTVTLTVMILTLCAIPTLADEHLTDLACAYEDSSSLSCAFYDTETPAYDGEEGFENYCNETLAQGEYHVFNTNESLDPNLQVGEYGDDEVAARCNTNHGYCCDQDTFQGLVLPSSCSEGNFTPATEVNSFQDACQVEGPQPAFISGYVMVNGSQTVGGALVEFDGEEQESATTVSDGYYSLNLEPGSYDITISYDGQGECTLQSSQTFSEGQNYQNNYTLEDCYLDGDGGGIDPSPIDEFECNESVTPENPYVCNPFNNTFYEEDGEEITCEYFGYSGGALACDSDSCQIDTSNCINCPSDPIACTESQCGECEKCGSSPICNDECNEDFTLEDKHLLVTQQNSEEVDITYGLTAETCDGGIEYDLTYCEPETGDPEQLENGEFSCVDGSENDLSTGTLPFPEETITHDAPFEGGRDRICYTLETQAGELSECIWQPSGFCEGKEDGEYCSGDDKITCENGLVAENESCDGACTDFVDDNGDNVAMCIADDLRNLCNKCSGPFGLHGDSDEMQSSIDFSSDDLGEVALCHGEDQQGVPAICYGDSFSQDWTSVGEYEFCADVQSCYDYQSPNSCLQDPCDSSLDCNWNEVGENIGVGVCAPQDNTSLQCEKCGEDDRTCTQELCSAYGERCHYTGDDNDLVDMKCVSPDTHMCEMYTTQSSCEGSQEYELDVTYFDEEQDRRRGTNEVITPSGDEKALGKCVWTGETCRRDANFKSSQDDIIIGNYRDCEADDIKCLSDFEHPITEILSLQADERYSPKQISDLIVDQRDETYGRDNIKTYISLDKNGEALNCTNPGYEVTDGGKSFCYPNLNTEGLTVQELNLDEPGSYQMNYYSKDGAKNLEPVQHMNFEIVEPLSMNVDHEIEYEYSNQSDTFLAFANIKINSINHESVCEISLYKGENSSQEIGADSQVVSDSYTSRFGPIDGEGLYWYNVTCEDSYQQETSSTSNFRIDGENYIYQIDTEGKVALPGEELQYSFETDAETTCEITTDQDYEIPDNRFGDGNEGGTDEWRQISENQSMHEFTVEAEGENGVYEIYPRCETEAGGETRWYYGHGAHVMVYGVDTIAPQIQLIDTDTGNPYNVSSVKEEVTVTAEADDFPSNRFGSQKLRFGTQKITQCFGDPNCEPTNPSTDSITLSTETPEPQYLTVKASDKGGNERTKTYLINLTSYDTELPEVGIGVEEDGEIVWQ